MRLSPAAALAAATALAIALSPNPSLAQQHRYPGPSAHQGLRIDATWAPWLTSGEIVETKPATTLMAQLTVHTQVLGPALVKLIQESLMGKDVAERISYATFDALNRPTWVINAVGARVQEIDLPAADAANTSPAAFTVKFTPAAEGDMALPTSTPAGAPAGDLIRTSNFLLTIGGVPWTTAFTVDAMTASLAPGSKAFAMPQLSIIVRGDPTTLKPIQAWFASSATKTGTLAFLSADLKTPIVVESFEGLRVTSITTMPATGAAVQRAKITMSIGRLGLSGYSTAALQ